MAVGPKEDSMTRRLASAALLPILGFFLLATDAGALSSRTRLCVKAAKDARRRCVTTCGTDFQGTFSSCFGPGASCAAACIVTQSNCLLDPVSRRADCQNDTDPDPTDGVPQGACSVRLRTALEDCTGPEIADPEKCASDARLDGLRCIQDCQLRYAPAVQGCTNDFNDCTQACASCRTPTDCPIPTLRTRAQ
jgi:hypothetical protein